MSSTPELTIYNEKIVKNIRKYVIARGCKSDFEKLLQNKDTEIFSDASQIIIFFDKNKKIIFAKKFKNIIKKINLIKWNIFNYSKDDFNSIFKIPSFLWENKRRKNGVSSRLESLKKENLSELFILDKDLTFILLEIPKQEFIPINELEEILNPFISSDTLKYHNEIKENYGVFGGIKILILAYSSILVASIIKILNVYPYGLINDSEIFLAIKLFLAIFLAIFSIFILLGLLAIAVDYKFMIRYQKINALFSLKFILLSYLVFFSITTVLASLNINQGEKRLQHFIPPMYAFVSDFYIDSKSLIVFDKNLSKPIIFLGVKDGLYYYYDEFNKDKLKENLKGLKFNNEIVKTKKIKKILLGIDVNSSSLINGEYKVRSIKDLVFDYNNTLVNNLLTK